MRRLVAYIWRSCPSVIWRIYTPDQFHNFFLGGWGARGIEEVPKILLTMLHVKKKVIYCKNDNYTILQPKIWINSWLSIVLFNGKAESFYNNFHTHTGGAKVARNFSYSLATPSYAICSLPKLVRNYRKTSLLSLKIGFSCKICTVFFYITTLKLTFS